MEGRGFLEGVNINPKVLGGVVRGISDMLTGKSKADEQGSQLCAADAASAAAFQILAALLRTKQARLFRRLGSSRETRRAEHR